jgi:GT2 family glycosyltransferase
MKETAIIIVNWNSKNLLKDCLDSLQNQTNKDFRIIIVDNGSTDESVYFAKANYPEIELIELLENTGFAKANNIGIERAFKNEEVRYILALNNDAKLESNFIQKITECAKNHSGFGSIQPKVLNFDGTKIDCAGILVSFEMSAQNRGYGEIDKGQYEKEEEIFGSSACTALYSREALEKSKLPENNYFDGDYFAYYEDVDLAWRMRLFGLKSYYCPKARVFHIHSATGVKYSPFKKFYLHRNQYYNIIKDLPLGMALKAIFFMPVRYVLVLHSLLIKKGSVAKTYPGSGKSLNIVRSISKGWLKIIKNLPSLVRKRKIIQKQKTVSNQEIKKWLKIYQADFKKIIYG